MATRPWTPADLGALDRVRYDLLDATSIAAPSGAVSEIVNKGSLGTAARLYQTTASLQPTYSSGVLTTDGAGKRLNTDNLSFGSVFSGLKTGIFYGIIRYVSGQVFLKWEGGSTNRRGFEGSARIDWPNDSTTSGSIRNFTPALTTSRLIVAQKTATTLILRINGAVAASQANTASHTNTAQRFVIGANDGNGGAPAAAEFRGRVGLIDDASDDTAQRLEGWLAWGMADAGDSSYVAALPANHPYKAARPTVTIADPVTRRRRRQMLIAS